MSIFLYASEITDPEGPWQQPEKIRIIIRVITNKVVRKRIHAAIEECDELLTLVKNGTKVVWPHLRVVWHNKNGPAWILRGAAKGKMKKETKEEVENKKKQKKKKWKGWIFPVKLGIMWKMIVIVICDVQLTLQAYGIDKTRLDGRLKLFDRDIRFREMMKMGQWVNNKMRSIWPHV